MNSKNRFFLFLMLFWGISASAQSIGIIRTDRQQYIDGQNAALLISLAPLHESLEYHVESVVGSQSQRVIQLSDREFAGVLKSLQVGTVLWTVHVYSQNKVFAESVRSQIVIVDKEIVKLKELKSIETDPDKAASLTLAIQNLGQKKADLKSDLALSRSSVGTLTKSINVAASLKSRKVMTEALILSTERVADTFDAGDLLKVDIDIDPLGTGISEEQEFDIVANFNAQSVFAVKTSEVKYKYERQTSISDIGTKSFTASLYGTDKAAVSSLRVAIKNGGTRKIEKEIAKESALSSAHRALYQADIDDLNLILDLLHDVVVNLRQHISTKTIAISIVAPPPVVIVGQSLEVTEGDTVSTSYSVRLSSEPTGTVTISALAALSDVQLSLDGLSGTQSLTLNFDQQNWNANQVVHVKVPDNLVVDGERNTTITHTASGGGLSGQTLPSVALKISESMPKIVCLSSLPPIWGPYDGGYYEVSLPHEPSGPVTVQIDSSGWDFILNNGAPGWGASLDFDETNWYIPQAVYISVYDGWMGEGFYTFTQWSDDPSYGSCETEVFYSPY
ncbi:hypothetical protein [Bdellovibrio bacteriovorus]|uniref:Uncharacterized protein n=1 Tax=Bdellovibrio bacteriovorus str. Tiberius TaxID=1069642 RepID=K7Z1G6_BDEBC|nr:hypothetical protein [Bdellovibrio bacteriovorus]AFY02885.1 Hypothetical protein Bdt_3210 [Bdellovibrio bacteriovorus str. Tiberius]